MNPLTNIKNITKLNERELQLGINDRTSWHNQYKDSAWLFIGGLPFDLTEGDIICVFSQYGEIVNINLVRDKKTGKSRGFCFLCYENQKSTILAVDNLNGIKLLGRTIRVDHVANYKPPKEHEDDDEALRALHSEGCAPQLAGKEQTHKAPATEKQVLQGPKKEKKEKNKKRHAKSSSSESSSSDSDVDEDRREKSRRPPRTGERKVTSAVDSIRIKTEKYDPGYQKYERTVQRDRSPHDRREGRASRRSPDDHRDRRKYNDGQERYNK